MPDGQDPKAEKKMLLAIASRPIDTNTTYTVGADVSRFQRRTVPAKTAPAAATGAMAGGGGAPVDMSGPVVRVARGNTITAVPVGGK